MRFMTLLAAGFWLATGLAFGGTLSLEDYLNQVRSQGPDYKSFQASAEGLEKQSHQQDLLYAPQLNASYNHLDDQQPQANNPFYSTHTLADSFGVSLVDKLPFGPSLSVGYAFNNINLNFPASAAFFLGPNNLTSYYQVSPTASISIPLFKDFGGIQTNAGVKKVQYQLESAEKGAAFQREQSLFNAKMAYWNLALVRSEMEIRQDTLARSQKIWEWTKRRVARNLADPPDALQAEASVRVAELDLQMAVERERSSRFQFNRFRSIEKEDVPEQLGSLEDSLSALKVAIPDAPPARLDLTSAQLTAKQQQAAYDEASQNIFPDITAFASWRGNGLDPNFSPANDMALQNNRPTYNLGAQFNLPLDVFTASRVSEGYKKNYESAQMAFRNKEIQVNQDWKDLAEHLQDIDKRLVMAAQIEEIQKNKANQERKRLELGRTTQFQLLSFENDYALARLNRLSLVLEKLSALAQAQWWLAGEK